jgi:hypothetical protein
MTITIQKPALSAKGCEISDQGTQALHRWKMGRREKRQDFSRRVPCDKRDDRECIMSGKFHGMI